MLKCDRDRDGRISIAELGPVIACWMEVVKKGKGYVLKENEDVMVSARAHKMSKSRGNVINPDHVVAQYGADSLRLYEMFMGPLTDTKVWSTRSVEGVYRFLGKVWRFLEKGTNESEATKDQLRAINACVKKVMMLPVAQ